MSWLNNVMVIVKHFKITRIICLCICQWTFACIHSSHTTSLIGLALRKAYTLTEYSSTVSSKFVNKLLVWLEILHEPCPVDTIGASSNMIALAVGGFQITRTRMGNCIKYNTFQIFQESFCWCCILLVNLIFWICQLSSHACLLNHTFDH